jgi:hypothetical protein
LLQVTSAVSLDKGTAKIKSALRTESPEEEEAVAALTLMATAGGKNEATMQPMTKSSDTFQGMNHFYKTV